MQLTCYDSPWLQLELSQVSVSVTRQEREHSHISVPGSKPWERVTEEDRERQLQPAGGPPWPQWPVAGGGVLLTLWLERLGLLTATHL